MRKNFFIFFLVLLSLVACGQSIHVDQTKEGTHTDSLTQLTAHYIDAAQADATLFKYTEQGKSYTILYDTGDWNKTDVLDYLASENITTIDLIVISHPHADHIGQLAKIIHTYGAKEVWMTGNTSSSGTFQAALEAVIASDANYHEPLAGEVFDVGPMHIEVLHPSKLTGNLNEDSLSLRFTYGDISFLFTGDAYKNEEQLMMKRKTGVQANILQLGHHGSNTSSDPKFISAVNPDIAIYSASNNNSYGHPNEEVVSQIQKSGIKLYGTDVHGTIIVSTDGKEYDIQTETDSVVPTQTTEDDQSCIDLNAASVEALQEIKHIGPARAVDIASARPFKTVEDLITIKGLGPASIAEIASEGKACVK